MLGDDARWMRAALSLAARALGQTWPNPAVGAILVRDGRVIGRGVTAQGGRPHAEALAIAMANDRHGGAQGATAYVTLEPCAHHGLTPPCADALAAAGIARLVCPMTDPDMRVSGRGFDRLRNAGVTVETGLMAEAARALNAGFLSRIERGRPLMTLKLATTLDGRIATAAGESRWITGPQARRLTHVMRAHHDAVLIGAGTARADDPLLDIRGLGLASRNPVRVVADGSLSIALTARLVATAGTQPLWLLHREDADRDRQAAFAAAGVRLMAVPVNRTGRLDMAAALSRLAEAGLTRVLCEGGGQIAASLLRADLVDRIEQFTAGRIIGEDGRTAVGPLALERLADAPEFRLAEVRRVGPDTLLSWYR